MPSSAHPPATYTLSLHDALPIWLPRSPDGFKTRAGKQVVALLLGLATERADVDVDKLPVTLHDASSDEDQLHVPGVRPHHDRACGDRKSTRLNSSHITISYAVFCPPPRHLHSFPTRRSSDLASTVPGWVQDPRGQTGRRAASRPRDGARGCRRRQASRHASRRVLRRGPAPRSRGATPSRPSLWRSEEHTSELQSHHDLVCRLLPTPPPPTLFPYTTLFRSGFHGPRMGSRPARANRSSRCFSASRRSARMSTSTSFPSRFTTRPPTRTSSTFPGCDPITTEPVEIGRAHV